MQYQIHSNDNPKISIETFVRATTTSPKNENYFVQTS